MPLICVGIGGNLNAASRQALMQKLARIDSIPAISQPAYVHSRHSFVSCELISFQPETIYSPAYDIKICPFEEHVQS